MSPHLMVNPLSFAVLNRRRTMLDTTDPNAPANDPNAQPTPAPPPAPVIDPAIALNDELSAKAALDAVLAQQAQVNTAVAAATTTEAAKRQALGQVVASEGSLTYTADGKTATTLLPNGDGTYHPVVGTFLDLRIPAPVNPPA